MYIIIVLLAVCALFIDTRALFTMLIGAVIIGTMILILSGVLSRGKRAADEYSKYILERQRAIEEVYDKN